MRKHRIRTRSAEALREDILHRWACHVLSRQPACHILVPRDDYAAVGGDAVKAWEAEQGIQVVPMGSLQAHIVQGCTRHPSNEQAA
jgi:hypothetical protein